MLTCVAAGRWGDPGGLGLVLPWLAMCAASPPHLRVVGMFSFPAAPLTTIFVRGAVVLAVVRLHSAVACVALPGNPRKKRNWGDLDWRGSD